MAYLKSPRQRLKRFWLVLHLKPCDFELVIGHEKFGGYFIAKAFDIVVRWF